MFRMLNAAAAVITAFTAVTARAEEPVPREYDGPVETAEPVAGSDHGEAEAPTSTATTTSATTTTSTSMPTTAEVKAEDPGEQAFLPPRHGLSLEKADMDVGKAHFAPGKGLSLVSKDERFAFGLSLRTGFMYTMVHHNAPGADPKAQQGVEIRRFRVVFQGHVFGKHNKYFFQLAFAPREVQLRDGTLHSHPVYDAYMQFERFKNATLRVGMYRPQYSRERLIQDINPLLIDRSTINGEFNLDRDIGLDLRSEDFLGLGKLRYFAGVFLGKGRNVEGLGDFGLLYTGRVDVMPLGKFDDYDASDQTRMKKLRMSFGAAYAYQDNAKNDRGTIGAPPADGGTTDYHHATADLLLKWAGFYLEAGYLFRAGRRKPGTIEGPGKTIPDAARNGQGWFAQLAFLIPRTYVEPAFRVGQIYGLRRGETALGDSGEIGGGLNYYFAGHNLKLQADYFRLYKEGEVKHGDDQLRVQLQVAF
ncbi:MAG TPA: porin [Nannocystaceae bacterium]|nr:porin [Nannocystaceae bacterium]